MMKRNAIFIHRPNGKLLLMYIHSYLVRFGDVSSFCDRKRDAFLSIYKWTYAPLFRLCIHNQEQACKEGNPLCSVTW